MVEKFRTIARRGRSARRSCAGAAAAAAPAAAVAGAAAAATRRPRPSAPAAVSYLASRRCPTRAPAGTGTSSRGGRAVLCRSGVASPRSPRCLRACAVGVAAVPCRRCHRSPRPAVNRMEPPLLPVPPPRIRSNARRCAVRRRYPAAHVAARALYARRFLSSGGGHFVQCPPHFFEGAPWWCPLVFPQRAVCACSVARGCWLMQPRRCVSKPVSCSCSARAARCQ